jgi:hypothetical protein
MADDDSSKALLERLCALQEEQLALTRESLERQARLAERHEKAQEMWEQQSAEHRRLQKAYEERETRHERMTNIRGAIILALWIIIAATFVISRFR